MTDVKCEILLMCSMTTVKNIVNSCINITGTIGMRLLTTQCKLKFYRLNHVSYSKGHSIVVFFHTQLTH